MDSTLTILSTITMPVLSSDTIFSMDTFDHYLVYSFQKTATIMDCSDPTNNIILSTVETPASIDDIRVRYPYLLIATNNTVQQYDMDVKQVVSSCANTTLGFRIAAMEYGIVYTYKEGLTRYSSYNVFRLTYTVAAGMGGVCLEGYFNNGTKCQKNTTYVYPITSNTTANTTTNTTTNTSNLTTNASSNTTNTTTTNTTTSNTTSNITTNTTNTNTTTNTNSTNTTSSNNTTNTSNTTNNATLNITNITTLTLMP